MNVLRYDSDVMTIISRIVDLAWLNILCFVCSIPILTSGAAISAKYYTAMKLERGEAPGVTRAFFHSFKQNFVQDLKIVLILIPIYAFFALDWYLVKVNGGFGTIVNGMLAIFTTLVAMTTFCVFPLVARFEMKTREALSNALIFGLANLPRVLLGIFLAIIPYIIGIWYYKWAWMIWLFIEVMALYYNSRFFIKKFDKIEVKAFGSVKKVEDPENDDMEFAMNFDEYDKEHGYVEKDEEVSDDMNEDASESTIDEIENNTSEEDENIEESEETETE